ncbi:MAG: hypothetical protein JXR22_00635 [Prolixibacteraceae bacterium]|nr:hypothetical protein [Prolixibacteraceae bacterium]
MKVRALLFVAVLGISFVSCDAMKDLTAIEVESELKVDIPLEATDDGVSLKSQSIVAFGDFKGEAEIDLATNEDVKDYVDNLRSIQATDVLLTLTGLTGDQKIETITITAKAADLSETFTATNIIPTSVEQSMASFITLIDNWDITENTLVTFTVTGKANFHVTNAVKAKIKVPSKVRVSPL